MADHPLRPATRLRLGEPLPHQQADRTRTPLEVIACKSRGHLLPQEANFPWSYPVLVRLSTGYPRLQGRLSTCYSPVRRFTRRVAPTFSHDLHVSGTPPAFVLSQDQTLHISSSISSGRRGLTRQTGGLTANQNQEIGTGFGSRRSPAARLKACTTIQFSKTQPFRARTPTLSLHGPPVNRDPANLSKTLHTHSEESNSSSSRERVWWSQNHFRRTTAKLEVGSAASAYTEERFRPVQAPT